MSIAKFILLGSGGVMPLADRVSPAHAFSFHDHAVLVDCGSGALNGLVAKGIKIPQVRYLFLSHLHADHVSELPTYVLVSYLQGRTEPIRIFGPEGTKQFCDILFQQAFPYISNLVKARKGTDIELVITEQEEGTIFTCDEYHVDSTHVLHGNMRSLAFRFNFRSGSVTISGDTAPCESLIRIAKGTDILVHECPFPDSNGPHPAHTIPSQLGPIAKETGAQKLLIYHFFPAAIPQEKAMIDSIKQSFTGEVLFGFDGLEIDISDFFV